jgi:hypothetical protein
MGKTVRQLAGRLVELGMATEPKAAEVLAGIQQWNPAHLNEELDEGNLHSWLPEFGVAVSVHSEDVDFVDEYYQHMIEEQVNSCIGGAVVFSDVTLLEAGEEEYLFFRRDGKPVWWHVEHESEDYVDMASVSAQFGDLDPGGDDPRVFHQVRPSNVEGPQDAVYVLATPEQAQALHDEFGVEFYGSASTWPRRRGGLPTAEPETAEWYMQEDGRYMTDTAGAFLEQWMSDMDGELAAWRPSWADFSLESLGMVEQLVLDRFASWDAVQAAAGESFVVGAVRYVGETLIRNAPGHWGYRDVAKSVYEKVPFIRSNTPSAFATTEVPLHILSRLAEDRVPGALAESATRLHDSADRYREALRVLATERSSFQA